MNKTTKKSAAADANPFFGFSMPRVDAQGLTGSLIAIEGADGSGRSTQIALLQEWLESNGYAVQLVGLRRSDLLRENIDELLANTAVTRQTLTLMYAADFYDQLERTIIPALRSGLVVLADRYIFTLTARAAVRGVDRKYLDNLYQLALRPDLTFWLTVDPKVAIERELKKASVINYWEAGRDMNLSADLYESFTRYQTLLNREFERLATRYDFLRLDGETPVSAVNRELRRHIGAHLKIRSLRYTPSGALAHLWK
ncbi:MAG: dTMP kinase [FCB group bacterium]|jgi:dTMP kinase|nr:dTMP kinase [FCB group bacterium]